MTSRHSRQRGNAGYLWLAESVPALQLICSKRWINFNILKGGVRVENIYKFSSYVKLKSKAAMLPVKADITIVSATIDGNF